MVKRLLTGLLALALLIFPTGSPADPAWKENTPGQKMLKAYITKVNGYLTELGEMEVNSLFEMYDSLAELGITTVAGTDMPEGVTVTVKLYYDSINSLLLRVNETERFPAIAAAFLMGLGTEGMTKEQALKEPSARASKAAKNPANSFEDTVEELNGTAPRAYYAYYPDQYHDGVSWMQLTIIFPLAEYMDDEAGIVSGETPTKGPDTYSGNDAEYEGYFSGDDYEHLEVFTTATPEPDSAAAELDPYEQP